MVIGDVPRVAALWAEYVPQTQFPLAEVNRGVTERNLANAIRNRNTVMLVGERDSDVVAFLHARIDYWIVNDQPFLADVALYPGQKPTEAAGLRLLRALHARLDAHGIEQRVVAFYAGIEEEKMSAMLGHLGYSVAGRVMKKGI